MWRKVRPDAVDAGSLGKDNTRAMSASSQAKPSSSDACHDQGQHEARFAYRGRVARDIIKEARCQVPIALVTTRHQTCGLLHIASLSSVKVDN